MNYRFSVGIWEGPNITASQQASGMVQTLRRRWSSFFNRRCLTGFPWYWPAKPAGDPAMIQARRIVRQSFGRDHGSIRRALAQILTMIVWPPAVIFHWLQIRRSRGRTKVPIKRFPGALWCAMRHNIVPGEYYAYKLWRPDRSVNIDNYLYSNEAARLFKVLNRPLQPDAIDDKLLFYKLCGGLRLPTPPVLAAFTPTAKLIEFDSGRPPERDLFVKPRLGRSGSFAERFSWNGADFRSNRGCRLGAAELCDYLAARALNEKATLLVQPALLNHESLNVDATEGLATARLVTGRFANGDVVPIFGFIYFAKANQIKAQHGYVALIDIATGRLIGPPQDSSDAKISNSPGTLPNWDIAIEHTQVAHGACSNYAFIGWDIAFTNHGPMLLEGNEGWLPDEYQAMRGKPLGGTKFADVLRTHLTDLKGPSASRDRTQSTSEVLF